MQEKEQRHKDQLLIDKVVLADGKRKHKNLAMAWVDYEKACDMVAHSPNIENLKRAFVKKNIISFFSAEIHSKLGDRTDILWRDAWFSR